MREMYPSLKSRIGCWLRERWKAELILRRSWIARMFGWRWIDICNRHERVSHDKVTRGARCEWAHSSILTLAQVFPDLGGKLLRHCLTEWPVAFSPTESGPSDAVPDVTFILTIRGTARLDSFRMTLLSILSQRDCCCEVIVVEQSCRPEFESLLPLGVRYVHTLTEQDTPFNRSWAMNVGAVAARGKILALHDADMIVPSSFASELVKRFVPGVDAIRFARFIFYLDRESSETIYKTLALDHIERVACIRENNSTPIALLRDAYLGIGGHDEAFFGWGREDVEFLDRVRTLGIREGAFLPVVHLWHEEAPNRSGDGNATLLAGLLAFSPEERIRKLVERGFGRVTSTAMSSVLRDR